MFSSIWGSGESALNHPFPARAGALPRSILDRTSDILDAADHIVWDDATQTMRNLRELILLAQDTGGATIRLPRGVISVHLPEAEYNGSSNFSCLQITGDGVNLIGEGDGVTIIRNQEGGKYAVLTMHALPLVGSLNGNPHIQDCSLRDFTMDGNCHTTTPTREIANIGTAGLERCKFIRMGSINSAHYGWGHQNGGYIDNEWLHCRSDKTQSDGWDFKDNLNETSLVPVSRGNKLSHCVVSDWGRNPAGGFPWAGFDLMGVGFDCAALTVKNFGASGLLGSAIRLKQGSQVFARGEAAWYSRIRGFFIDQSDPTVVCDGITNQAPFSTIEGGYIRFVTGDFCEVTQPNCLVIGVTALGRGKAVGTTRGFVANSKLSNDSEYDGADDATFIGCQAIDVGTGFQSIRTRVQFRGCTAIRCTKGVELSGASGVQNITDVTCVTCDTPLTSNNNSGHILSGVRGGSVPRMETPVSAGVASVGILLAPTRWDVRTSATDVIGSGTTVAQFDDNATSPVLLTADGTLKRVTVGAADSGGAGFKLLRVPN